MAGIIISGFINYWKKRSVWIRISEINERKVWGITISGIERKGVHGLEYLGLKGKKCMGG